MGIREIAKRARVSTATVSRVFNMPDLVKNETRERVLEIAKELEYKKYYYRPPALSKNSEIGVVIPDVLNSYFARVLEGITKQAKVLNLSVILYLTHDSHDSEMEAVDKLLEREINGIVLVRSRNQEKESISIVRKLNKYRVPFVLVDRDISTSDNSGVFLSNTSAVHDAISMLIEDGYKNISFITGPHNDINANKRLDGYISALEKHGVAYDESRVTRGNFTIESGLEITLDILEQERPPDAIFSCANQITIGCLKAIRQKGMVLEHDIKLFSFNRLAATHIENFDISYIEHSVTSMGERSVVILNNKLVGTKGLIREMMDYTIHY